MAKRPSFCFFCDCGKSLTAETPRRRGLAENISGKTARQSFAIALRASIRISSDNLTRTIIGQIRQIPEIRSQQFCPTLLELTTRTEIERKSSPLRRRGAENAQRTSAGQLRDDHSQSHFAHRSESLLINLTRTIIGQIRQIREIRSQQFRPTLLEITASSEIERKSSPRRRRGAENSQRTSAGKRRDNHSQSPFEHRSECLQIILAKTIIGQIRPIPEIRSQQ
jgi:hypothetical protein